MARNIELLTKVRDLVKTEPERLDMGTWASVTYDGDFVGKDKIKVSCGTTACIAGWAVQLAGDQLLVYGDGFDADFIGDPIHVDECVAKNGRVMAIDHRAEKLLGLSAGEAAVLFTCNNTNALPYLDRLIAGDTIDYDDDYDDDE